MDFPLILDGVTAKDMELVLDELCSGYVYKLLEIFRDRDL